MSEKENTESLGKSKSLWIDSTRETDFLKLDRQVMVDVVVIGGGLAGLMTAYLLKKYGKSVAVVESDRIAKRVTAKTTAKITSLHPLIYQSLISRFGQQGAWQYAQANQAAIELIANTVKDLEIECEFERKTMYVWSNNEEETELLRNEVKATESVHLPAVLVENLQLSFSTAGALKLENQAQFHPRKFLLGLSQNIFGKTSYVFEKTKAIDIKKNKYYTVTTDRGSIETKNVVIATQYPFFDKIGSYYMRLKPLSEYVVAVTLKRKRDLPNGMFIGAQNGFSIRTYQDMLIVGGPSYPTGESENTEKYYQEIKSFTEKSFEVKEYKYHWSTLDYYTPDGVPYIGRLSKDMENVYVACGFNGWGMTHGVVSAMMIRDMILKENNPWAEVYNPSRYKITNSLRHQISQGVTVVKNLFLKRIPHPSTDNEVNDMKRGEGKIIYKNNTALATYKDSKGKLHYVSGICTHMGCSLKWNNAEKTWDCPCHGSRFDFDGKVIHGPALKDLSKKQKNLS